MLKGVLDLCVLAVLADGPTYGYGLVGALHKQGLPLVAEGSVYPLLARLTKRGYVRSYTEPSPGGPSRKYYELTEHGMQALRAGSNDWFEISAQVGRILMRSDHVETSS